MAQTPARAEVQTVRPPHVTRLASVIALIAINALLGAWMHLNFPAGLPSFSFASVFFGIPTVLGLLPPAEKDGWVRGTMQKVRAWLARPAVCVGLWWTFVGLVALGTSCSSLRVETDRGKSATVRVVEGSQTRPSAAAIGRAQRLSVGRDQSVSARLRPVWPVTGSFWAYTSSHVSQTDRSVLPWRPARWVYPDDFDEIVTLFVLPTKAANATVSSTAGPLRFLLLGAAGDTVFDDSFPPIGVRIEYFARTLKADSLAATFADAYRAQLAPRYSSSAADSVLLQGMVALADTARRREFVSRYDSLAQRLAVIPGRVKIWMTAARSAGRRPLHAGERLRFQFQDEKGIVAGPFDVVLDHNPYALLIDASHVNHPAVAPQ